MAIPDYGQGSCFPEIFCSCFPEIVTLFSQTHRIAMYNFINRRRVYKIYYKECKLHNRFLNNKK
jgi:hypothetical protein